MFYAIIMGTGHGTTTIDIWDADNDNVDAPEWDGSGCVATVTIDGTYPNGREDNTVTFGTDAAIVDITRQLDRHGVEWEIGDFMGCDALIIDNLTIVGD